MAHVADSVSSVGVDLLRDLSCWKTSPCCSIYVPIERSHPNSTDVTRLTLKSALRNARRELGAVQTLSHSEIDELLAPVQAVLAAPSWAPSCRGVAFFAAPGRSAEVQLDVRVPSMSVVADRFVVTPLVAAIRGDDRFFVLAVSHNRVRFLRGDRRRLVDAAVPGLPRSRAEALWYEDHERQITVHGGSRFGVGRITGTLHGSPSEKDLRKQQLQRFFRVVDQALLRVLHAETVPLLVAGVGFELATYREVNHYPHLTDVVDVGNPERLSTDELHERLWPVACRALDGPRRALVDRVNSSPMVVTSLPEILAAGERGRIAALLVQPDRLSWGLPDAVDGRADRRPGDVELVTMAIGAALEHGATVVPAAAHEMPGDIPTAALLRH